jgi:pullulanase/glycogen debranching enzyme
MAAPPDWPAPSRWKHDPYARDAISFSGNSIVVDRSFDWSGDNFQMPSWNELVIYELQPNGVLKGVWTVADSTGVGT